jgi:hypothetical protein
MNSIKLHQNSIDFLESVFNPYKEEILTDETIIKNPIIHMYAEEDTYDDDGTLNGYIDSLFFKADIYDPSNGIKYSGKGLHDSISFYDINPWQVRIFKDGSTMVLFHGECTIGRLTTLCIYGKH